MADVAAEPKKLLWGEVEDDGLEFLLPPTQVIGPDENGIKKVIEYKFNDEGQKVKITRTIRIRKLAETRLNKRALEHRSWRKFGDAVHEEAGSRLTMISTEEINIERPRAPGTTQEETKATGDLTSQSNKGQLLMLCRTCGKRGDHWTAQCPHKDLAQPSDFFVDKPHADTPVTTGGPSKNYVPPNKKQGAPPVPEFRRRNEENSVRVTNLSEDTREEDLQELFRPFGNISRVFVALDKNTGTSRGFGFVNFANREDGERAISKLDGYGYDNLILKVEWAAPRAN